MSKVIKNTESANSGSQVECPCSSSCTYAIPESEWNFKHVTDHFCDNGHLFRIEGTDIEEVIHYEIHPKLTDKKNLV